MTNEEAIKLLSQIKDALLASNSWLPSTDNPIKESFGMAINALTAQPEKRTEERTETHACDLIDRQAAIELVKDVCDAIMSGCESWYDPETEDEVYKDIREVDAILKCNKEVRIALRNMPSAQQEIVRCKDCKYAQDDGYEIAGIKCCTCALTRQVMNENAESECNCFNRDLSGYDICYNCKYYIGGGDWGLFCSHRDMYHHLGKFSDDPCKRYERRTDDKTNKGSPC